VGRLPPKDTEDSDTEEDDTEEDGDDANQE
jgi:hypothetical protein